MKMKKSKNVEIDITAKDEISFDEFKAWINGLLYGKGSTIPDEGDWKEIKSMMERVIPDKIVMENPEIPFFPTCPQPQVVPYVSPETEPWKPPFEVTCGVNEHDGVAIGMNENDCVAISCDEPPSISGGDYGGFAGFGIADGYKNQIGTSAGTPHMSFSVGCTTGTILPCPSVFVEQEGTVEESLTALEKAQVLLKQFKDTE